MKRLAIVVTHPIQYYAPGFKLMTERGRIDLKVFYTWGTDQMSRYDPGFKREIAWDIPLLEGYNYTFVRNTSKSPGSSHFKGIINPTLVQEVLGWLPNAVLVYGWNYHSHLRLLRKLKGRIPIWFRGDSHLLDPIPQWKASAKAIFLRWVYHHIDLAFYVGTANKQYYLRYGLKENQLHFAPHAIDNHRFYDTNEIYGQQAKQWKNRLGIKNQDIVLLFAGKFEPKKQPLLLLETVQLLNESRSNKLKLILVGNGRLEEALKERAQNDPNVLFLDFQNQSIMPIVYRLGNIFFLPSSGPGETWGLAINEALASGIPVITSDKVGCSADLVLAKKTGRIFRTEDKHHLLQVLEQMLQEVQHGHYGSVASFITSWSFEQQATIFEKVLNDQ